MYLCKGVMLESTVVAGKTESQVALIVKGLLVEFISPLSVCSLFFMCQMKAPALCYCVLSTNKL